MSPTLFICVFLLGLICISAMYDSKSDVISATDADFKDLVLKHNGIVMVEFYAPWCGHCKSLTPEYEKAASVLKGVVKIVALDATVHEKTAQKYGIKGFPTLKVFGADKKNPVDYQGQRTSDGIITECMKSANQLVKDRKAGKASSSGSSGSTGGAKSSGSSGGSTGGSKNSGSQVIELTEANFNALVLESSDHWMVEFYAPWCGHCKNLAPEWESAAKQLKGSVKFGAVDATVHGGLAQTYGVKGYPSIKLFAAGKSKTAVEYKGPREAAGIVEYAMQTLDSAGVPQAIHEITSSSVFAEACGVTGKICVVMFVPHILDSGAEGRNKYLATLSDVAKGNRGKPMTYLWTEAGSQSALEDVLSINQAYPGLAVMSTEKKIFGTLKLSWSLKNINAFVAGVLSGKGTSSLASVPTISKFKAWDGKDAVLANDEIPLDEMFNDE